MKPTFPYTTISLHRSKHRYIFFAPAFSLLTMSLQSSANDKTIQSMYERMARDINAGKPLVATVYVALCDNDSQGIAPVKNRKICMGNDAKNNLYWGTSGGLWGHARDKRWKRISVAANPTPDIAVRAVWKKRFVANGLLREAGVRGGFDVVLVGVAYRGEQIRRTMVDYLKAVNRDEAEVLNLSDGTTVETGGNSHVVGWIGHDYFMDEPNVPGLIAETRGDSTLDKGVFGLSCISDHYFRPAIERDNVHILALNTQLTFPSAYTVMGLLRGIAAGKDHKGLHKEAVRAFAEGQKRPAGTLMRVFNYGDHEKP